VPIDISTRTQTENDFFRVPGRQVEGYPDCSARIQTRADPA